jgi:hypothetical protein
MYNTARRTFPIGGAILVHETQIDQHDGFGSLEVWKFGRDDVPAVPTVPAVPQGCSAAVLQYHSDHFQGEQRPLPSPQSRALGAPGAIPTPITDFPRGAGTSSAGECLS